MIKWVGIKSWDKCGICWAYFKQGIQHENSLHCYKLGIPIVNLKISLEEFVRILKEKGYVGKYSVFSFPLSIFSKGVVILYFESEEEMKKAINDLKEYVKDEGKEKWFYNTFVNVDWINGFNYRRGCPEYDKFGDWRSWKTGH
ncbi:hypothetical protein [Sulfurisphaera tokodaii]|uniref:Uncharacterized protein n=2 Tax=Sulfurisphaera tokodaii TaxID=111955 RepID=Q974B6_SULTO|nr:hypothetical protein [Sulfurisphaera tokodaii]BAB65744.1 hypothetical protein STK_07380 [Sulfurisphaera tokodaii str. 7]HII72820.1 hypothetical protein [Sulfurisphaera tokodaii]